MLISVLGLALGLTGCSQPQEASEDAADAQKTITVLSMFTGEQQVRFEQSLVPFEEETGIDVVYEGTQAFPQLVVERVNAGNPPDIAIFPQPGLMAEFVEAEQLVPLTDFMEIGELRAAYPDTWIDLGSVEDVPYAIWYRASVKSLVWYNPTAFTAKGYDIPRSWAELMALSDRIVAEGGTPWCIGLGSGEATGWPGTDWIEDILLRTAGPEAYAQWIDHQLAFNSPQVIEAFNKFGSVVRNPKYVSGGADSIISTNYGDSALGLFTESFDETATEPAIEKTSEKTTKKTTEPTDSIESPECYLHRQASFVASFFPDDKEARVDYDAFPLPGIDDKFGLPILVAGDALGLFNNTPEAQQLMRYFASPIPHEIVASLGDSISPHKQVDATLYPNIVSQNIARILADADIIRFDGSDMMPAAVGTGTFWQGMVDFTKGKSAADVTQEIDAQWPN